MSRKKAMIRRRERRKNRIERITRFLVGNLAYVILGGAILLFIGVVYATLQHIPATTAGSPNAAQAKDGWIRLTSKSPSAVIAAARQSALFHVDRSGSGDYLKDLSRLENPILVRAYHRPGSPMMPDYYVIPIDDASGVIVGAAELELNKAHNAIRVTAIVTYPSSRRHGQMALVSLTSATNTLARQRHVGIQARTAAALIYFPVDAHLQETGKIVWKGGGEYPADPIWLLPGADGQQYVVGTDGLTRPASQLPVMTAP